ncbi:hypothetical protein AAG906_004425 [Vitis piasezkii]
MFVIKSCRARAVLPEPPIPTIAMSLNPSSDCRSQFRILIIVYQNLVSPTHKDTKFLDPDFDFLDHDFDFLDPDHDQVSHWSIQCTDSDQALLDSHQHLLGSFEKQEVEEIVERQEKLGALDWVLLREDEAVGVHSKKPVERIPHLDHLDRRG